jgi:putative aldouronate transport system substrate-binding protein
LPASSAAGSPAASGGGEMLAGVRLPTFAPIQGPKPDLPGDAAKGLDDGYMTFPKTLFKSVPTPPGKGGAVQTLTQTLFSPPPPVDQNPAWQEVNKRLNAQLKMNIVISTDYRAKLGATMAGGDLPDVIDIVLPTESLPQFLKAQCADLTPYLSGDAVKDYPNLAALPTLSWKAAVYSGGVYAVPIPRAATGFVLYQNMARMNEVAGAQPKTPDDYKKMLQQLTSPSANKWALGGTGGTLGLNEFAQLFGTPNNWRLDPGGKLVRHYETDEFKAAVGWMRDLYASGVFHPNSMTYTNVSSRPDFVNGRFAMLEGAWANYNGWWHMASALNPPIQVRPQLPLALNGKPPVYWLGVGNFGVTALKKASADRVKELLGVLNLLAAPFGSEEGMVLDYGVEGPDYTLDAKGNPVQSKKGMDDVTAPWRYLTAHPEVLYDPAGADYAKTVQGDQQALLAAGIQDPTLGYYSPTDSAKGRSLNQTVTDRLSEIITGRSPLSELDQVVKDWASQGGNQIRTEYQQAIQAAG